MDCKFLNEKLYLNDSRLNNITVKINNECEINQTIVVHTLLEVISTLQNDT